MSFLRRFVLALVVGYIFFFYSERMFWSFFRSDDSIPAQALGWLVYSVFAYMTLAIIVHFRVRSVWSLFLAGAAFGWIGEGIYAMTFFGAGGIPLPFSIIWTGVAWHALITVLIGWYCLYLSMTSRSYFHTTLLASGLGLFWGIWGMAWILETPPIFTTASSFINHALLSTFLLIIAFWIMPRLRPGTFSPSKSEVLALITFAALFTILVTIPTVLYAAGVLLLVFGILYLLLRVNRRREGDNGLNILIDFEQRPRLGKYLCILAMPLVASVTYIGLNAYGVIFPSNLITLLISSFVGTVLLGLSIYKILKA